MISPSNIDTMVIRFQSSSTLKAFASRFIESFTSSTCSESSEFRQCCRPIQKQFHTFCSKVEEEKLSKGKKTVFSLSSFLSFFLSHSLTSMQGITIPILLFGIAKVFFRLILSRPFG
jgi:hypothetical protein